MGNGCIAPCLVCQEAPREAAPEISDAIDVLRGINELAGKNSAGVWIGRQRLAALRAALADKGGES